jgi:hypothetical protein
MPLLSCLCALNFPILDIAKPDGVRLCLQLRSEPRKGDNRRLTSPVQPDFHIRGAARNIPVKRFPAEWERLGKAARFLRNEQLAGTQKHWSLYGIKRATVVGTWFTGRPS